MQVRVFVAGKKDIAKENVQYFQDHHKYKAVSHLGA